MTDIADLTAMTDPASGDLFHVIDVSSTDTRQDRKITRQYLLGYTEYIALLTQTSTNAPSAVEIKNDTGATVAWSYVLQGLYRATFSNTVLTANKTVAILVCNDAAYSFAAAVASTTLVNISTQDAGAGANSVLSSTPVIIRIYT